LRRAGREFEGRSGMKHFENLFAAWMFVWAVFFVYEVSIARKVGRLWKELEDLKQQLHGK
jgi:CcmD family protein